MNSKFIQEYIEFNNSISPARKIELLNMRFAKRGKYESQREWKIRRNIRIKISNCACEKCGKKYGLDAHHKNYENYGFENFEDLEILCNGCHIEEHHIYPCLNRNVSESILGIADYLNNFNIF